MDPLPASPDTICLYAQLLSRSFSSPASVRNYVSGVKTLHTLLELPVDSFSGFEVRMTLKGIARLNPHVPRQAQAMTPQILAAIHDILDFHDPLHTTMWCLFILSFFTLARKSNLVVTRGKFNPEKQLCRSDVKLGSRGLLVTFRWTKTIQFGQRVLQIPILAIPESKLCPLSAYRNMVSQIQAVPSDPAFLVPGSKKLVPVSYSLFQKFLKSVIKSIGLEPSNFTSHSFRRGGANWAFRSQVPADLIKVQGDWASQAYLRYLDFSLDQRVLVSHCMSESIKSIKL